MQRTRVEPTVDQGVPSKYASEQHVVVCGTLKSSPADRVVRFGFEVRPNPIQINRFTCRRRVLRSCMPREYSFPERLNGGNIHRQAAVLRAGGLSVRELFQLPPRPYEALIDVLSIAP